MILDADIKQQLAEYLKLMENEVVIKLSVSSGETSNDMAALVNELAAMSSKIKIEQSDLPRTPGFSINRIGEETGIVFAGIPLGHEFTSLVLALLQEAAGHPKWMIKSLNRLKGLRVNITLKPI